ncbi:MAG: DUF4943 domain-containing protein [Prolixibacteraceae bacterium]|nr:DUF4943 domain-containing protein [Prolixibacteraceae bacterium]
MKNINLFFSVLFILFSVGCEKDEALNETNEQVNSFVEQLKDGTYNDYEYNENGEKLWTNMPEFQKRDIPYLLEFSKDTSLICPCNHFPVNPVSSIPPYRVNNGEACIMLGEYLLWCVEWVIEDEGFASLVPVLVEYEEGEITEDRLNGEEVLKVRDIYQDWWKQYGDSENPDKMPLDGTGYKWR